MSQAQSYTTRLQAGLGLVPETLKLLGIWQPGMTGQDLLKAALASGDFPSMAARRLRNVVIEAFCPRYLIEKAAPAQLLKTVHGHLPREDVRLLCFLFTCRANAILGDFVRLIYWPRYAAGGISVTKQDSLRFVSTAVSDGRIRGKWSETTIIRVARYLLGACADFDLLGAMKGSARPIGGVHITPNVASILAHDLHFRGVGDNALLDHADWGLFGLEADDVLAELKWLSLRGELIVQSAARLTQIAWRYNSMNEVASVLAAR